MAPVNSKMAAICAKDGGGGAAGAKGGLARRPTPAAQASKTRRRRLTMTAWRSVSVLAPTDVPNALATSFEPAWERVGASQKADAHNSRRCQTSRCAVAKRRLGERHVGWPKRAAAGRCALVRGVEGTDPPQESVAPQRPSGRTLAHQFRNLVVEGWSEEERRARRSAGGGQTRALWAAAGLRRNRFLGCPPHHRHPARADQRRAHRRTRRPWLPRPPATRSRA